jgi:prepilin-type N-terminal cleavage/methylation domain-containing protein
MTRAARPGFTLLEVMLAVSLALALLAALLGFYKQVADTRTAVGAEVDTISAERTVMELATVELRGAMPYPQAGLGLEGTTSEMRFATVAMPGADAWLVRTATEGTAGPSGGGLQVVGYRLGVSQDADGNNVINGVERTSQRLATAQAAEEGKQIEVKRLAPSMRFLRLRYWNGTTWLESWSRSDLPGAVEIVMGEQPLPDGVLPMEYPYDTFRRVVYVPAGAKTPTGTIIRGLDESAAP